MSNSVSGINAQNHNLSHIRVSGFVYGERVKKSFVQSVNNIINDFNSIQVLDKSKVNDFINDLKDEIRRVNIKSEIDALHRLGSLLGRKQALVKAFRNFDSPLYTLGVAKLGKFSSVEVDARGFFNQLSGDGYRQLIILMAEELRLDTKNFRRPSYEMTTQHPFNQVVKQAEAPPLLMPEATAFPEYQESKFSESNVQGKDPVEELYRDECHYQENRTRELNQAAERELQAHRVNAAKIAITHNRTSDVYSDAATRKSQGYIRGADTKAYLDQMDRYQKACEESERSGIEAFEEGFSGI